MRLSPLADVLCERDLLWEDCRNSLGIARLLVHERRPEAFVGTACRMAVDNAFRAALSHAGIPYPGHVSDALARLGAPAVLWEPTQELRPAERLAAAEKAVGWAAGYLKGEAPGRSWGY